MIHGNIRAGTGISMEYAVADMAVALDSVSQVCDAGAMVIFTQDGGRIEQADGTLDKFDRVGDTYMRTVLVDRSPVFRRPGCSNP